MKLNSKQYMQLFSGIHCELQTVNGHTVKPLYRGHPWDVANWLLYKGGLIIQCTFNRGVLFRTLLGGCFREVTFLYRFAIYGCFRQVSL